MYAHHAWHFFAALRRTVEYVLEQFKIQIIIYDLR